MESWRVMPRANRRSGRHAREVASRQEDVRYNMPEAVRRRAQEWLEAPEVAGKKGSSKVCLTAVGQRFRASLAAMGIVEPVDVIRRILDAQAENDAMAPRPPALVKLAGKWKECLATLERPVLRERYTVAPVKKSRCGSRNSMWRWRRRP